jgi:hypothetical protein
MPDPIERSKFLTDLLGEVDRFDETLFPPHDKLEEGDTKIGELSPWLKKVFALARFCHKQAKLLGVERDYHSAEDANGDDEVSELKYKSDLLMEILWAATRSEKNLWSAQIVSVKENWMVTRSQSQEGEDDFKRFILRMMRGK